MQNTKCSKRTADLAIRRARDDGFILHDGAQYCLPLDFPTLPAGSRPGKTCLRVTQARRLMRRAIPG